MHCIRVVEWSLSEGVPSQRNGSPNCACGWKIHNNAILGELTVVRSIHMQLRSQYKLRDCYYDCSLDYHTIKDIESRW